MSSKTVDDFLDRVRQSAGDGTLVRLNLGASIQPDGIRNVFIRPVRLKDAAMLSFVYRHPTRDVTKNFAQDEAIDLLRDLLGQQFLNGFLSTTTGTAQLTFRKGRPTRMLLGKPEVTEVPDLAHDRAKPRPVPVQTTWLRELGVWRPSSGRSTALSKCCSRCSLRPNSIRRRRCDWWTWGAARLI